MKICFECKYHAQGTPGAMVFYEQFCTHKSVQMEPAQDPVTGAKRYGKHAMASSPHPLCRDINTNGKCKLWEAKETNDD